MPWIKQIDISEATGLLKTEFDKALQRAGRVWHIIHIMSVTRAPCETVSRFTSQP